MDTRKVGERRRIGRFEVIESLGAGGFGEVFRVWDPKLEAERAVKVFHHQGAEMDTVLAEARAQASIRHRAVLPVHDVVQIDARWVIVMDFAAGGSLRDRLEEARPLSEDEAIRHARDLAEALALFHEQGRLHGDIKPENILFDSHGQAWLSDFGLARRIEHVGAALSRRIGTPEYMGPEQIQGIKDPRSEIWSLGAVFYEMLTGHVCFEGDSDADVLRRIEAGQYTPLRRQRPSLGPDVARIVDRMLSRDAARRWQSMAEVAAVLDTMAGGGKAPSQTVRWVWISVYALVTVMAVLGAFLYAQDRLLVRTPSFYRLGRAATVSVPEEIRRGEDVDRFQAALEALHQRQPRLAYAVFDLVARGGATADLAAKAAYHRAATALHFLANPELAAAEFRTFLGRFPEAPHAYRGHAHFFLAQIYLEKGRPVQARHHLEVLLKEHPDNPHAAEARLLRRRIDRQQEAVAENIYARLRDVARRLQPVSLSSLGFALLGLILAVATPLAWILSRAVVPSSPGGGSWRRGRNDMICAPPVRRLMALAAICWLASVLLTLYEQMP